jgi:hypothetical protein
MKTKVFKYNTGYIDLYVKDKSKVNDVRGTVKEVSKLKDKFLYGSWNVIIPVDKSLRVAAGVVRGFCINRHEEDLPHFFIYTSEPVTEYLVREYVEDVSGYCNPLIILDKDHGHRPGQKVTLTPEWATTPHSLETFKWFMLRHNEDTTQTLFWNV